MENILKEELIQRISIIDNDKVINSIAVFVNAIDNLMNSIETYEENQFLDRIPKIAIRKAIIDEALDDEEIVELNMQWLKYW